MLNILENYSGEICVALVATTLAGSAMIILGVPTVAAAYVTIHGIKLCTVATGISAVAAGLGYESKKNRSSYTQYCKVQEQSKHSIIESQKRDDHSRSLSTSQTEARIKNLETTVAVMQQKLLQVNLASPGLEQETTASISNSDYEEFLQESKLLPEMSVFRTSSTKDSEIKSGGAEAGFVFV